MMEEYLKTNVKRDGQGRRLSISYAWTPAPLPFEECKLLEEELQEDVPSFFTAAWTVKIGDGLGIVRVTEQY